MGISKQLFGMLPDGREVHKYTLEGAGGLKAGILTYGGAVQTLEFHGKDIVLGFDDMAGYLEHASYQGALIGRIGNRVTGGKFNLNGVEYDIGCNTGGVHLHGGLKGFDKQIWDAVILSDGGEPSLELRFVSPDGENGYPGELAVSVVHTITADNVLRFQYKATSDKDTYFTPTNHAYFNLGGYDSGDMLDTVLSLQGDTVLPLNEQMIPSGERRPVAGTPFDFKTPKPIGRDIHADNDQLNACKGYDIYYPVSGTGMREMAKAESPKTGIGLVCSSDMPGVQFYCSCSLNEKAGKGGIPLYQYQGFCLETQHYPDSPSHPDFPSILLKAGDTFGSVTEYAFYMNMK